MLTLSQSDDRVRLITTNFDRLFVEAMKRMQVDYQSYCAPLLPIPKKRKWDGLVYLHGLLPETQVPSELERLVVSSGDFGLAYLTERWAARFVGELLRGYTVCFVGYSIDDPVLRYMMDALAADRLLGEKAPDAYAFGGYSRGAEAQVADEWTAKNVTPILYSDANRHSLLHKTLREWADSYRDGIRAKEAIVMRHGRLRPQGSTKQDNFVGRMLWALSDKSGLPAKAFAELDPSPPIDWLDEFGRPAFNHHDLVRFQVTPEAEFDKKLSFSLLERPWPYSTSSWMRLAFRRQTSSGYPDAVMRQLARWLLKHLDDPRMLLWVARNGGLIPDHFGFIILDRLSSEPVISPRMEAFWRLALSGRLHESWQSFDFYNWSEELRRERRLTPLLRIRLRELLAPRVRIAEGYRYDEDLDADGEARIDWQLTLNGTNGASALRDIFKSEVWKNALADLMSDATDILREAMDIAFSIGKDNSIETSTYVQHPSIAPHPQNRTFRDWTVLIDFARDAWLATAEDTPKRAQLEFQRWAEIGHPIFRRLQLYALAQHLELFGADQAVEFLLLEGGRWLWSVETQREALQLIEVLASQLSVHSAELLQSAILERQVKPDALDPELAARRVDREVWRRLVLYRQSGGVPSADAEARLAEIAERHPKWGQVAERDQFPVYMEAGNVHHSYEVAPVPRREYTEWIRQNRETDDFEQGDNFPERCRLDFPRTVIALLDLARQGDWVINRWRQALNAWSTDTHAERSWRCVGQAIEDAPDQVIADLSYALSGWVQECGKFAASYKGNYIHLASRILDQNVGRDADELDGSILTAALNHPVGQVADGLLKFWYSRELNDGQRLPPDLADVFTRICNLEILSFAYGRLFLCSNAISLFRVDEDWTTEWLLGLFDWERSEYEATIAWSGFLWSPRLYWPLLRRLKSEFLFTAKHYSKLGELSEQYAGLLTFAALDSGEGFTKTDFANATKCLPEDGLVQALQTVTDGLESSGGKSSDFWDNRVKPYFRYVWPKSEELRTPKVAGAIATLIVAANERFKDALDLLEDWLFPTEHADFAIHQLDRTDLTGRFPEVALRFLHAVVDRSSIWSTPAISHCLDKILQADQSLIEDKRMKNLLHLLQRA
ncbi:hypothetical protein CO670_20925 [Rhizobium sp. J15]|nr:hypothetical protein CO670_20925 [Rhizobium sp. J15]